jgi:cation diffusion facilitator CzcD-associated flavoprotein CzcO
MWAAYLQWYRRVLSLPVRNGVRLERVEGAADHVIAHLGGGEVIRARKLVLATGIDGTGRWWMPEAVERLPRHLRAHTADAVDFAALRGKRVGVLGAAASAFDNASTALEAGAASVDLFSRRAELQRVQPFKQMSYAGFFRHMTDLDDAWRWRVMRHLLTLREAFPKETWERATRHTTFRLHLGAPWTAARAEGGDRRASTASTSSSPVPASTSTLRRSRRFAISPRWSPPGPTATVRRRKRRTSALPAIPISAPPWSCWRRCRAPRLTSPASTSSPMPRP